MPGEGTGNDGQPPADHWIELNTLIPGREPGDSPTRQPAPPKLKLVTADMGSDDEATSDIEPAPKSAILGLAQDGNSGMNTWLPPSQENLSSRLSPSKRIHNASSPSSLSPHTSSRRSSSSKSRTDESLGDHLRSPFRDPRQRRGSGSSVDSVDSTSIIDSSHLSGSSPPLSPRRSPYEGRATLSVPRSPPGGLRLGSHSQPRLTVERSFHNVMVETPLQEVVENPFAPEDAHHRRNWSSMASPERLKMKRRASLGAALSRAELEMLDPEIIENQNVPDDFESSTYHASDEHDSDDEFEDEPKGRTLFYFKANHPLRRWLFSCMLSPFVYYGLIVLTIAQVVVLIVEMRSPFQSNEGLALVYNPTTGFIMMAFYAIYTLKAICECIAFGVLTTDITGVSMFWKDLWWWLRLLLNWVSLGALPGPKVLDRSLVGTQRCFLRKSWGRVELVSIAMFWSFVGVIYGNEATSISLIVAGLAHIRILRLLDYIAYTRVILQSLKTAIPLLQNVLFFIAFFLSVWAIVGVQSFNGSLRRVCIYDDIITSQNCGSWLEPETLRKMPYLLRDHPKGNLTVQKTVKGYTCPVGSQCVELRAFPKGEDYSQLATVNFDNFFNSLEIVFIMMSNNSFTPIMYNVINSEYLVSSLFFISGVLVLGIWLANLTVAVMVSCYGAVKDLLEDLHFWTPKIRRIFKRRDVESQIEDSAETKRDRGQWILENTTWGRRYTLFYPVFALLALADLVMQAAWTPDKESIFAWELALVIAFGVDITLRFLVYLPYWRYFFYSFTNWVDLTLVIVNAITLAFYKESIVYAWLTFFQLIRIYRLVGALQFARIFWIQLFGNYKVLLNLTGFFFLTTLLCSIVACKMLRGQFPMETDGSINTASFYDLCVAFFSMYQVASTENWTDVLFWTIENVSRPGNNVIGLACMGILFCGWLFFANFLLFNFFIGVMSENLHGAISNKREEQVRSFANDFLTYGTSDGPRTYMRVYNGFTLRERFQYWLYRLRSTPASASFITRAVHDKIEREFVAEFLDVPKDSSTGAEYRGSTFLSLQPHSQRQATYGHLNDYANHPVFQSLARLLRRALKVFHRYPKEYRAFVNENMERRRNGVDNESNRAYVDEMFEYQVHSLSLLERYSREHPYFDRPLCLFSQHNRLRIWCQQLFDSSHGQRVSGVYPKRWTGLAVRFFFVCATAALVIQTCINTPLHTLNERESNPNQTWTWLRILDLVFGTLFTVEFLIKVIADGLHFTPNAYTHSPWNLLDAIALISLWMTFINDFYDGPLARYLRGIVALRALRLVTANRNSERLLNSIFLKGFKNLLAAAVIAMSVVVPYAVWGKNIFHDRLTQCNDDDVNYLSECSGEFRQSLFDHFDVLSPRVVEENYFSYNNFWSALLIQFGVLSLEGWVDVLQAVTSITGNQEQPETYSSKGNAVYPIAYHYIGSVLIMSMFIAVIIRNYALTMGTAFLTEEQLSWLDVKNTLKLVKPTPRPPRYRPDTVRHYLLQIMPTWISSIEVWALLAATINMAAYYYPHPEYAEYAFNIILLISSTLLACLSVLRLIVLKPRLYLHNWWNPFGLIVYLAVIIFTILNTLLPAYEISGSRNASRAAFICLLLMQIPRTKRLHEFFTIATAAIAEIAVLLETWFVLFVTYAIALNQTFGLTKLGTQSSPARNFRTVPKALIALFTMSCGEGWNELLIDYTMSPPNCLSKGSQSECGISAYAYVLFVSWNVISMYVFANLFISLICEACWYVYRSGPVNIRQQDILSFLESWQQFDPSASGQIPISELYRFLGHTRGYFSLSIYSHDPKYNVHQILEGSGAAHSTAVVDPYRVDMDAINKYLADMPVEKYREKKKVYELFTMQAILHAEALTGGNKIMPFGLLMRQFPLYKDMDPSQVLTLEEYIALKVQLHEVRIALAAEVIVRQWRMRKVRESRPLSPGLAYHHEWDLSRSDDVYWVA